jgi:hypothetical protein
MKNTHLLPKRSLAFGLVVSALLVSLLALQGTQVWADTPNQLTSTVTTSHFSVSLVFPTSASPGQSEQISATTTATSSANIISVTIDISSYVNGLPVKLASQTILGSTTVQSGAKWQTLLTVNIPADAQPGPLIGTITEVWQNPNYYSSYYGTPYYYTYYYTVPYYTGNYPYYYNTYQYNMPQRNYPNSYNTHQYQYNIPQQGYQNSNTFPYQLKSYPNGFTVMQTPQQNQQQTHQSGSQSYTNRPTYPYQPSYTYGYRPSYYYSPNYYEPYYFTSYYPMYANNYSTQLTSQQTVLLTYVT